MYDPHQTKVIPQFPNVNQNVKSTAVSGYWSVAVSDFNVRPQVRLRFCKFLHKQMVLSFIQIVFNRIIFKNVVYSTKTNLLLTKYEFMENCEE